MRNLMSPPNPTQPIERALGSHNHILCQIPNTKSQWLPACKCAKWNGMFNIPFHMAVCVLVLPRLKTVFKCHHFPGPCASRSFRIWNCRLARFQFFWGSRRKARMNEEWMKTVRSALVTMAPYCLDCPPTAVHWPVTTTRSAFWFHKWALCTEQNVKLGWESFSHYPSVGGELIPTNFGHKEQFFYFHW